MLKRKLKIKTISSNRHEKDELESADSSDKENDTNNDSVKSAGKKESDTEEEEDSDVNIWSYKWNQNLRKKQ